jgi:hypothetical protein
MEPKMMISLDDDIWITGIEVRTPAGPLGITIVLETPDGGVPKVQLVKSHGPLAGRAQVGDRLVAVDGTGVTSYSGGCVTSRRVQGTRSCAGVDLC